MLSSDDALDLLGSSLGEPMPLKPLPWRMAAGALALALIAAVLGVIGAAAASGGEWDVAGWVLAGALATGVPAVVMLWRRLARTGRIAPHERGFVLLRGARRDVVAIDALESFVLHDGVALYNGRRLGLTYRLVARSRHGRRTRLLHYAADGAEDEVGPYLLDLLPRIIDVFAARVQSGEPVRGDGWTLDASGLHVRRAPPVPLSEVRRAGVFEGRVAIWRDRDDAPFFSTPVGGPNAMALLGIASRHAARHTGGEPQDPSSLGLLLFEKRSPKSHVMAAFGFAAAIAAGGVVWRVIDPGAAPLGPLSVVLLGALVGLAAMNMARSTFQVREHGVVKRTLYSRRVLRFDEIERFGYRAVRQYYNGAYIGTITTLLLAGPEPSRPLKHALTVRGQDDDLERLRQEVSLAVADRLRERLRREGEVRWGARGRLTRTTLELPEKRLLGRGPVRALAYGEPLVYTLHEGRLRLQAHGSKTVFELSTDEENFYPGLLLFEELVAQANAAPAQRPQSER